MQWGRPRPHVPDVNGVTGDQGQRAQRSHPGLEAAPEAGGRAGGGRTRPMPASARSVSKPAWILPQPRREHKNPIYFNYIFEGHSAIISRWGPCCRPLRAVPGEGEQGPGPPGGDGGDGGPWPRARCPAHARTRAAVAGCGSHPADGSPRPSPAAVHSQRRRQGTLTAGPFPAGGPWGGPAQTPQQGPAGASVLGLWECRLPGEGSGPGWSRACCVPAAA